MGGYPRRQDADRVPFFLEGIRALGAHEHEPVVVTTTLTLVVIHTKRSRIQPLRPLDLQPIRELEPVPPMQGVEHVITELVTGIAAATEQQLHPDLGVRQHQVRSEEHTSELQSRENLVCRLLLEKKKTTQTQSHRP